MILCEFAYSVGTPSTIGEGVSYKDGGVSNGSDGIKIISEAMYNYEIKNNLRG